MDIERNDFVCKIKFPTHSVHIHYDQDRGHISCMKTQDNRYCEYEFFDDIDLAGDYIMEPMETIHYRFQELGPDGTPIVE